MSDYKIIFSLVQDWGEEKLPIPWDEGCPLSLDKMQVSRNTVTGKAFFQARLKNISNTEVLSYKATLMCEYEDGSTEELAVESLDADMTSLAYKEIAPVELSRGDIGKTHLSFDEVRSAKGDWKKAKEVSKIPFGPQLNLCEEAKEERKIRLKSSGCTVPPKVLERTPSKHGSWWRCACGKVNVGFSLCSGCGLNPVIEEALRDENYLEKAFGKRKEKAEEKERLEKEEKERKKANAKIFVREHKAPLLAAAVVAAILILVFAFALSSTSCSMGVHVPTSQEIEAKANSISGDKVELKRDDDSKYEDSYSVLVGGKDIGTIFLSDCELYLSKSKAKGEEAYERISVAMMMACDPSLDYQKAKKLFAEISPKGSIENNGVKYESKYVWPSYSSSSYYIFSFTVLEKK